MDANVQLSAEEMRLVTDPAWILTQNSIVRKVVHLFADLSAQWRQLPVPAALGAGREPKISKGEQYKGLPWVMLDYPRVFGREDVLAIRTMFWWGHSFHVTLHLKGKFLRLYLPVLKQRRAELAAVGFEVGVSEDEWEHEHSNNTYDGWRDGEWTERPFLKLSARCELSRWTEAPSLLTEKFVVLIGALCEQGD